MLALLVGAALLLPASILAGSSIVPFSHSYVVRGNVIGGFRTATDGYPRAKQLFGGPYSSTQSPSVCIARWPDGLVITFKRKLPYAAFKKACLVVKSAKITGKRWHTDRGLRVGSPLSQLKRLYAKATWRTVAGKKLWVLTPSLHPALAARVKNGKVVYFAVVRL
jgi:hypothetical protein